MHKIHEFLNYINTLKLTFLVISAICILLGSQSGMIEFIDVFDKENDELKRGHAHAHGKHARTFQLLN